MLSANTGNTVFKLLMWIQQSVVFNLAVVVVGVFFFFFNTQVQECRDLKTVRLLRGKQQMDKNCLLSDSRKLKLSLLPLILILCHPHSIHVH